MCKRVWEINRILGVTWNHPYIKEASANNFRDRRLLRGHVYGAESMSCSEGFGSTCPHEIGFLRYIEDNICFLSHLTSINEHLFLLLIYGSTS